MISFAFKRLLNTIPILFLIISIAFFMMRAVPGGPFDAENMVNETVRANLIKAYNLDKPLWQQYVSYLKKVSTGDLGPSFKYQDFTVTQLIAQGLPTSFALGGSALLLSLFFGLLFGGIAALRPGHWFDQFVLKFSTICVALPTFVTGPLLTLIFAVTLKWLPVGGWGDHYTQAILPILALTLPYTAYISRLSRASMRETLTQPFVLYARAKGLSEMRILLRHVLRPSFIPVLSYLGPSCAALLTGSVVVEHIFGIPGLGRYFVHGALNRDYTLVMGMVIFYGALIIFFNLVVDLLYGVLNPQVRIRKDAA